MLVENRQFEPTPPPFGARLRVTPSQFRRDLWRQVPGRPYGVVCVILHLAILDRQTHDYSI